MAGTRRASARGRARAARGGGTAGSVRVKRAYEAPAAGDGYRVLVDRLWPRGVRKDALAIDAWMKEIAPSDELRRWFGHDPSRWEEFAARYGEELRHPPAAALVAEISARAARGPVTLVYGAKDEQHNQAVVLRDVIAKKARVAAPPRAPSASVRGRSARSARAPRANPGSA